MLIRLLSGERGQTLLALRIDQMVIDGDSFTFYIFDLMKTSRPGWHKGAITLSAFPLDPNLCVIHALRHYLRLTSPLRGDVCHLLISSRKPYKAVSRRSSNARRARGLCPSSASLGGQTTEMPVETAIEGTGVARCFDGEYERRRCQT